MPDALTVAARANHVLVGVLILAGLAFAAIGAAQNDTFYLRLATEALIFGGLALSVDILLGYTGLLSLGQALVFRAGRLPLRAGPQGGAVVLAGAGRGARRRAGARPRRRHHRDPRARRLFRADHLRPGPGGRQGRLQHPRARRVGRAARRADHRHRSRRCFGVERVAGRLLPGGARRHHGSVRRRRPTSSIRRSAAC